MDLSYIELESPFCKFMDSRVCRSNWPGSILKMGQTLPSTICRLYFQNCLKQSYYYCALLPFGVGEACSCCIFYLSF